MKLRPHLLLVFAAAACGAAALGLHQGASAGSGEGGCHQPEASEGRGDAVTIRKDNCFSPAILHVEPGTTVSFTNAGPGDHNVAGLGWGSFMRGPDGLIKSGQEFSQSFDGVGYYPFACTLHFNMVGVVIVGDPGQAQPPATAATGGTGGGGLEAGDWALIGAGAAVAMGLAGGGVAIRRRRG